MLKQFWWPFPCVGHSQLDLRFLGNFSYIMKPIDLIELLEKVKLADEKHSKE